jgi:hypothetical protein
MIEFLAPVCVSRAHGLLHGARKTCRLLWTHHIDAFTPVHLHRDHFQRHAAAKGSGDLQNVESGRSGLALHDWQAGGICRLFQRRRCEFPQRFRGEVAVLQSPGQKRTLSLPVKRVLRQVWRTSGAFSTPQRHPTRSPWQSRGNVLPGRGIRGASTSRFSEEKADIHPCPERW